VFVADDWERRDAEPFTRDGKLGNLDALRHGAHSPRTLRSRAVEIADTLAEIAPWTALPPFRAALDDLAFGTAQLEALRADMSDRGMLNDDRQPVGSANFHQRVQGTVNRLRSELGLTAVAWGRLVASLGSGDAESASRSLEHLQAVGRDLDRTIRALPGGVDVGAE
jgi:hypothetical protein